MKWGKRSAVLECVWMLVINFDYSCVMHAVQIPSCSRVRRSIELLHGDCRKPVCARQASWYLVVQVHNAPAKKKKKKEVQEAKGVYYLVTFEPLRKSLSSCTCLLTPPLFARRVHTLRSRHTLYLYSPINSSVAFSYNTVYFQECFGIWAFYSGNSPSVWQEPLEVGHGGSWRRDTRAVTALKKNQKAAKAFFCVSNLLCRWSLMCL